MLTLKNIFWVVLVLLNLSLIFLVSYSRLKPEPEATPGQWEDEVAHKESSSKSANWRFATVNTVDIPALDLSDTSSAKSITLVSEDATGTAPEVATADSADTQSDAKPKTKNTASEEEEDISHNTVQIAEPGMTNSNLSNRIENVLKAENDRSPANTSEATSDSLTSDTFEVAAANTLTSQDTKPHKAAPKKKHIENNQAQENHYKVDTYYDGNLVRTEETDNRGNRLVTVKETMDGLGEVSPDDANYVEALEQLDNNDNEQTSQTPRKTSASYQAKENSDEGSIDHFNKINVSDKNKLRSANKTSLAKQIEIAVSAEDFSSQNSPSTDKAQGNYFQALDTESAERANQMRTIKIVSGDTLWSIAKRAYGSGFKYGKIFDANPYLSDPNKIEVGDTLRVPI